MIPSSDGTGPWSHQRGGVSTALGPRHEERPEVLCDGPVGRQTEQRGRRGEKGPAGEKWESVQAAVWGRGMPTSPLLAEGPGCAGPNCPGPTYGAGGGGGFVDFSIWGNNESGGQYGLQR